MSGDLKAPIAIGAISVWSWQANKSALVESKTDDVFYVHAIGDADSMSMGGGVSAFFHDEHGEDEIMDATDSVRKLLPVQYEHRSLSTQGISDHTTAHSVLVKRGWFGSVTYPGIAYGEAAGVTVSGKHGQVNFVRGNVEDLTDPLSKSEEEQNSRFVNTILAELREAELLAAKAGHKGEIVFQSSTPGIGFHKWGQERAGALYAQAVQLYSQHFRLLSNEMRVDLVRYQDPKDPKKNNNNFIGAATVPQVLLDPAPYALSGSVSSPEGILKQIAYIAGVNPLSKKAVKEKYQLKELAGTIYRELSRDPRMENLQTLLARLEENTERVDFGKRTNRVLFELLAGYANSMILKALVRLDAGYLHAARCSIDLLGFKTSTTVGQLAQNLNSQILAHASMYVGATTATTVRDALNGSLGGASAGAGHEPPSPPKAG